MLLTEPLLICPSCVFGVIVMLEHPATTHFQCYYLGKEVVGQNIAIHGPIHPPLNTVQSSCPVCRKAPSKHDVSTPMLHGWDGVLGIVLVSLLEFLTFSNNCANSCCPLTKLFAYCPLAHPSLVQVYNFFSLVSLDSSLVLSIMERLKSEWMSGKQVSFIQLTSSNRCN